MPQSAESRARAITWLVAGTLRKKLFRGWNPFRHECSTYCSLRALYVTDAIAHRGTDAAGGCLRIRRTVESNFASGTNANLENGCDWRPIRHANTISTQAMLFSVG